MTQLGDLNTLYAKLLVDYDQTRKELKETETEQLRLRQQIVGLENKNSQLQNEIEKRERLVIDKSYLVKFQVCLNF